MTVKRLVFRRLPEVSLFPGLPVRNLRYNEVLAAVALGIPVSKLETRFRDEGLLTDDVDLVGFCVERIRQLLD